MASKAPSDEEVYAYLGPQRRWVFVVMNGSFLIAGASLLKFSLETPFAFPMIFVLGINVLGMTISTATLGRHRITAETHRHKIEQWRASTYRYPSIDVYLPTCGEPLDVLENTYRYVEQMQWGGALNVYVLDDADRKDVAELADHYNFQYIVRDNRDYMKKAGNLAYAYARTDGDFIIIFDADFVPRKDFLSHLIPYMDDDAIAIVQSPQYFETSRGMGWLERGAGATQELFYKWIQPARDRYGAAICVGTCAVYRRAALREAGGFAQIEHSEDVHTGIAQLLRGSELRYVAAVVSAGLSPDELAGFLNQQYRWCNGSMSLLASGMPSPLLVSGPGGNLTKKQRLCFWSGFVYYISTAVNVFTVHIPTLLMAGLYPQDVRAWHVIPFIPGVWVWIVLLPRLSHTRWRLEVVRIQIAYSFCHALAIIDKLRGTTKGWTATGAVGATKGGSKIANQVAVLGSVTIALTLIAGALTWTPACIHYGIGNFWPMGLFWALYGYLMIPLMMDFLKILGFEMPAWIVSRGNNISMFAAITYTLMLIGVALIASKDLWWHRFLITQ